MTDHSLARLREELALHMQRCPGARTALERELGPTFEGVELFTALGMYCRAGVDCTNCRDTGLVCEDHPGHPWPDMADVEPCCGGAGMACPSCAPLPAFDHHT